MSCGRELLTTLEEQTHLHCKEVDGRWIWCWSAVQTQAQVTVYVRGGSETFALGLAPHWHPHKTPTPTLPPDLAALPRLSV